MSNYDKFLIVGDFNSEKSESAMNTFCEMYHLNNLVKGPTCFKNPGKPSYRDLILKNCPKSFKTVLLDIHKLMLTILKMHYVKPSPKVITYRD